MAMNGDTLGVAIANALGVTEETAVNAWKTIAGQIVNHITTSAQVTTSTCNYSGPGTHPPGTIS